MHTPKTCFHMTSNVWVSGVKLWSFPAQKCEVLLLDTAQREDASNQQVRKFGLVTISTTGRGRWLCMAKQLSLGSIPSDTWQENFKIWLLKLSRLTSHENIFFARAFTGRCNWQYVSPNITATISNILLSCSYLGPSVFQFNLYIRVNVKTRTFCVEIN